MMTGLGDFHAALAHRAQHLVFGADGGTDQPFIRGVQDAPAQVAGRFVLRAGLFDDLVDLGTGDELLGEALAGIAQFADVHGMIQGHPGLGVDGRGAVGDEDQPLHLVDIGLSPAHNVRDFVKGGRVDGRVEDRVQPAFGGDHFGALLAQFVEIGLGLAIPMRAVLMAVDVHGETRQTRFFQLV